MTSNQLHFDSELHKQMRTKKIKLMFPEKGKKIIEHYTKATQKVMHTSARQESTIKTLCSDLLSEMCDKWQQVGILMPCPPKFANVCSQLDNKFPTKAVTCFPIHETSHRISFYKFGSMTFPLLIKSRSCSSCFVTSLQVQFQANLNISARVKV